MAEHFTSRFGLGAFTVVLLGAAGPVLGQVEGRVGDGMVQLTWTAGAGDVTAYHIYRRDYGASTHYSLRATVDRDTGDFTDTGLDNGLPYYYKVVPVVANGTEGGAVGEAGLCPMRSPIWERVWSEPTVAAADVGIPGATSVSRPGCVIWGSGLWYVVSAGGRDVIGHANFASQDADGLDNPTRGVWIEPGEAGQWDAEAIGAPDTSGGDILYSGMSGGTWRIGAAHVNDDRSLSNRRMILDVSPGSWDSRGVCDPVMANVGAISLLYYSGFDGATWRVGLTTWGGEDAWTKHPDNPVLSPGGPGEWDNAGVSGVCVTEERLYPPLFTMYYTGTDGIKEQIGYATSVDGVHWAKHLANPVLPAGPPGSWCSAGVGHPCSYDSGGRTYLWFEGTDGVSTGIGRAVVYRSRAFGKSTGLLGPEWLDTTIEHFNVPTIYDAIDDLLIELWGFRGNDYQLATYYSRTVGWAWNGNPVTFGLGWYGMGDYPSHPRLGSYFPALFAHEAGHNFGYYPSEYYGGTLSVIATATHGGTEGWLARVWENYALEQLSADPNRWGLAAEQVAQVTADADARRNGNLFLVLASEYGWHIWRDVLCACRPGIVPSDIRQAAVSSAQKDTVLICMLSAASQTDLRPRFRAQPEYVSQIDDAFYETYYSRIATIMAGEQEPPDPPSSLSAVLKPGPRVKLYWAPSASLDRNHCNVYSNDGAGAIDYSSALGVAKDPLGGSWISPIIGGGRLYRFGIRAVDHWGNEEKNTSAVVSVLVPPSPAPYIRQWLLLGPFFNSDTGALTAADYTVAGEAQLDPSPGELDGTARWRRGETPSDLVPYFPSVETDRVDLSRVFYYPSLCATYASTRVFVPSDTVCHLWVAHDDDCRIWLNGAEIYTSGFNPSEVAVPVALEAGWNRLCLKVCNYWGGYWFTARFCDAQGGEVPGLLCSTDAPGSAPAVSLSNPELVFNDVPIGRTASLSVNVLNRGAASLAIADIKIRGESAAEFGCPIQTLDLAPGTAGQLIVAFVPKTIGVKSAELVVATNDPNLPVLTIPLSGAGRNNALYVNDESTSGDVFAAAAGNDDNSGLDPGSPLRRIGTALERFSLQEGDVIYVDAGLYAESVSVFSIDHQFTIRGAGRDLTIVDGGRTGPCVSLDNVTDIHIEQMTLQHGKGIEGPWIAGRTWGGALIAAWTDVSLCDVALKDSTADYGGGAVFAGGNVELRRVLVSGNKAGDQGGGLYFGEEPRVGSRHYIEDCNLIGNVATGAGGGLFGLAVEVKNTRMEDNTAWAGGGAYVERRATLDGCVITANQAIYGGGIDCGNSTQVANCTIAGNTANDGGGVYMWGQAVVSRSAITGNSAINGGSGGGVYTVDGGTVQGCTIQGNATATNWGGGLCLVRTGTVKNSLVSGNWGAWGGGICCYYGGTVQNCTVVGNSASTHGGGVHCLNGGAVTNTIMYSNRAPKGSNYFTEGEGGAYAYCRATPRISSGPGNIDADPRFVDLGGWDANGTLDALDDDFWVDGDYHLKSQAGRWDPIAQMWITDAVTSPCIDAGDPASPVGDEPSPNGGRINMGMYGGTAEASKS